MLVGGIDATCFEVIKGKRVRPKAAGLASCQLRSRGRVGVGASRCAGPQLSVGFPSFAVGLKLQNLKAEKTQQLPKREDGRVRTVSPQST